MSFKNAYRYIAWGGAFVAVAAVWMAVGVPHGPRPELPIMQSFWATPRFNHEVSIFGTRLDMSRYDLHERYERELTNLCYTHNSTLLTLKRANRLFPRLVPILREEGIPEDFIYLCCIESSLDTRAKSPAGACGLWQLMPSTARELGLTVGDEVDERYHTERATRAACRYLKQAYQKFGDWMTVAAAYNAGQGGISRRLQQQHATSALDLLLVEETSRYMFRIMAMKEIMRDPYRYGYVLHADQLYRPIATHDVTLRTPVEDLASWAEQHHITYYQLKDFNPWLRDNKVTRRSGTTFQVAIPEADDLYYDAARPFPVYDNRWVIDNR